ncbi:uncharacterized protein LOC111713238 isoform X2 [Eurytemora carolleeae]|uniref:uncharacterized protein LOC111713238 isoform X2 n=1 Tax=Eurytemora carolleeae TaxID=1294199 RepID=UPI000C77EE46|nr:uncharacterized protein LOC111713238 isoform X2 [Eurytemora carolleeae]|eukprot:XP_023343833.1 uncharacterized protein LOC111713238 isoform X2 [Eurytemora affinis]
MRPGSILLFSAFLELSLCFQCYKGRGDNYRRDECAQCEFTECMCIKASPLLLSAAQDGIAFPGDYPPYQGYPGNLDNRYPPDQGRYPPDQGRYPGNDRYPPGPGFDNQFPQGPGSINQFNGGRQGRVNVDYQSGEILRDCWANPFTAEQPGCSSQTFQGRTYYICRCMGELCNSSSLPALSLTLLSFLLARYIL